MKKKICIVINNIERTFSKIVKGGGSVVAKNIILELLDRDDVELQIFSEPCNFDDQKFPVKMTKSPHFLRDYNSELSKTIESENFDKVISLNIPYPFKTYMIQSQSYKFRCKNLPWWQQGIKKLLSLEKITSQNEFYSGAESDYIAVSKSIKEDYVKNLGLDPDKIKVVYPATQRFFDDYIEPEKKDFIRLGIVAGSSMNKGGHQFIFALGLLKFMGYKFGATVILPKYEKDKFAKLLVKIFGLKSDITFLYKDIDMKAFYSSIDCLVLPSLNEAFGLVAIEAMACSKPCLISSTAGVAEIVEEKTSFIYNRKSFFAYLKALIEIIKLYKNNFDFFKEYSKNAFELSKKYTWKSFVDQIIE